MVRTDLEGRPAPSAPQGRGPRGRSRVVHASAAAAALGVTLLGAASPHPVISAPAHQSPPARVAMATPSGRAATRTPIAAPGSPAVEDAVVRAVAAIGAGPDSVDHHAVNAVVYNGWKMFEVYCTRCHGEDAVGSSFAPALIHSVGPEGTIDHKAFFQTVTNGRPSKGMPTWGNLLSPEQKEDIWYYLRARSVGGLAPGRPHIAKGAKADSTALPPAIGKDTTWKGPTT